jgi:hypothetical protein
LRPSSTQKPYPVQKQPSISLKNITIRLLESEDNVSREIRDYLVEDQDKLKVMSSVEMITTYPFEFTDYLQKRVQAMRKV